MNPTDFHTSDTPISHWLKTGNKINLQFEVIPEVIPL